ncbi:MAG: hypothetical protein LC777_02735 [Actinobacteria bacterium]|nr:hypothetical protein [Actinomycetota bacterium]
MEAVAFMVQSDDPLAALDDLGAPEGSVSALARVLVTEDLLGTGRASSIESFSLGPSRRGERQLELTWREPQRYTSVEPHLRTVKGMPRKC